MSITIDFDNIIQIANNKTLGISTVKYGDTPSIKNVGSANDIRLEVTIPPSGQNLEIEIGKVETGEAPSVKKRLDNGKLYLDFVLPIKGDQGVAGPQGDAATIEIGQVSIGNMAKVENVGTKNKAILNFTLPYASGQGSYIPGNQSIGNSSGSGGSFGGDRETAEELKNVTAGINRSAKATEELETTIANILAQVTAMVNQNNVIISRVVNQSEELTRTLGDRIDANKMAIKAIQMSVIDKAMLDDTKSRMASCEQTVSLLRGEVRQVFTNEIYRNDMKDIDARLDSMQVTIDAINAALKALESINESISQLNEESTKDRADIELLQTSVSELSTTLAGKQDAGKLVTTKDLDAGLKNSVDSIAVIRTTANQNTKKIADVVNDVNSLAAALDDARRAVSDVQASYAAGDQTNKSLIDALNSKVDSQTKVINETIAEIQQNQAAAEDEFVHANNVYSKEEIDEAKKSFLPKSGGEISGNVKVKGAVSAESFTGRLIGNADSATTAGKATFDGQGNEISKTYVSLATYNVLTEELVSTADKADKAAEAVSDVSKQIASNATEISELKTTDENLTSRMDALSAEKASNADVSELRNMVNTDRKNNDAKHKAFEDELSKFMPKDATIQETQLDSRIIERFNGIQVNAEAISLLQPSQKSADAKIAENTSNIIKVKNSATIIAEDIEQMRRSITTPKRVSLAAIEQMFNEYMPGYEPPNTEPDPVEPEPTEQTEPVSTEPEVTEPSNVESAATEPAGAEPESTEPETNEGGEA